MRSVGALLRLGRFNRLAPGLASVSFSLPSSTLTFEAEIDLMFVGFSVYPRAAPTWPDFVTVGLAGRPPLGLLRA